MASHTGKSDMCWTEGQTDRQTTLITQPLNDMSHHFFCFRQRDFSQWTSFLLPLVSI